MSIITLKQKRELITSIFGEGNTSSDGNDIAVHCPICIKNPKAKKKKKLSIAIETGMYHCWVCESKGKSLSWFVKKNVGNFKNIQKIVDYYGDIDPDKKEKENKTVQLPSDFRLVACSNTPTAKKIKKYLKSRGMTEEDFYRFKAGYSNEFEFRDRVIFPSFDENLDINFYVTRKFIEKNKFAIYKNCDASKKDIIFNEHLIDWEKPVILVEGLFDAVKAGENSIPLLGSWVDTKFSVFRKIIEKRSSVILGLDPDAKDKEIKVAKLFYQNGIEVSTLNNLNKDLGDSSREEVKNLILSANPYDNMTRTRYLISRIRSGSTY